MGALGYSMMSVAHQRVTVATMRAALPFMGKNRSNVVVVDSSFCGRSQLIRT
jgi:hypothetical protein